MCVHVCNAIDIRPPNAKVNNKLKLHSTKFDYSSVSTTASNQTTIQFNKDSTLSQPLFDCVNGCLNNNRTTDHHRCDLMRGAHHIVLHIVRILSTQRCEDSVQQAPQ